MRAALHGPIACQQVQRHQHDHDHEHADHGEGADAEAVMAQTLRRLPPDAVAHLSTTRGSTSL